MENASDQKQIDRKRQKREEAAAAERLVLRTLMSQQMGRLYLWNELSKLNVFSQTLQFGRDGYAATAWAEGKRSVGLELMARITQLCPEDYVTMIKENQKTEIKDEQPARTDPDPADPAAD